MPYLLDKMASSITVKTGHAYPEDRVNEASISLRSMAVLSSREIRPPLLLSNQNRHATQAKRVFEKWTR